MKILAEDFTDETLVEYAPNESGSLFSSIKVFTIIALLYNKVSAWLDKTKIKLKYIALRSNFNKLSSRLQVNYLGGSKLSK